MSNTQHLIAMIFGALIAIVGLALLLRGSKESRKAQKDESGDTVKSRIEVLGLKLEMSTPALTIFLVGCAIFVMPFFLGKLEPAQQEPVQKEASTPEIKTLFVKNPKAVSNHNLELLYFGATCKRNPPKVGDIITFEYTVKNVGDSAITFDETFVAARNPHDGNADFGHSNEKKIFPPGEDITVKKDLVADVAGQWKFWPCYTLILPGENEDETYCPSQWESSFVEVVK